MTEAMRDTSPVSPSSALPAALAAVAPFDEAPAASVAAASAPASAVPSGTEGSAAAVPRPPAITITPPDALAPSADAAGKVKLDADAVPRHRGDTGAAAAHGAAAASASSAAAASSPALAVSSNSSSGQELSPAAAAAAAATPSVATARTPEPSAAVLALTASQREQQAQLEKLRILEQTLQALSAEENAMMANKALLAAQTVGAGGGGGGGGGGDVPVVSAEAALEFARNIAGQSSVSPPGVNVGGVGIAGAGAAGVGAASEAEAKAAILSALESSIQSVSAMNEGHDLQMQQYAAAIAAQQQAALAAASEAGLEVTGGTGIGGGHKLPPHIAMQLAASAGPQHAALVAHQFELGTSGLSADQALAAAAALAANGGMLGGIPLAGGSGMKKKKEHTPPCDASCQSIIECGELDPSTGERTMQVHVPFFGKIVEIYTAVTDTNVPKKHLYRASALAEKFGYATNKVGMYLARRRAAGSGIYQATAFRSKPSGRTGLKAGGYFLTMDACTEFETHFKQHDDMLAGSSSIANAAAGGGGGGTGGMVAVGADGSVILHAQAQVQQAHAMAQLMQQQTFEQQLAMAQETHAILSQKLRDGETAAVVGDASAEGQPKPEATTGGDTQMPPLQTASDPPKARAPKRRPPKVSAASTAVSARAAAAAEAAAAATSSLEMLAQFSPPPEPSLADASELENQLLSVPAPATMPLNASGGRARSASAKKRSAAEAQLHGHDLHLSVGGSSSSGPARQRRGSGRRGSGQHASSQNDQDTSMSDAMQRPPLVQPLQLHAPESKDVFAQHQPGLSPLSPLSPSASPLHGLPPPDSSASALHASSAQQHASAYQQLPRTAHHQSHYAHFSNVLASPAARYGSTPISISLMSPPAHQGYGGLGGGGGAAVGGQHHFLATPYGGQVMGSSLMSPMLGVGGGAGGATQLHLSHVPQGGGGAGGGAIHSGMMSPLSPYPLMSPGGGNGNGNGSGGGNGGGGGSSLHSASVPLTMGPNPTSGPGMSPTAAYGGGGNGGAHPHLHFTGNFGQGAAGLLSPYAVGGGAAGSATPLMSHASFSSMLGSPLSSGPMGSSSGGLQSGAAMMSMPSPSPPLHSMLPSPTPPGNTPMPDPSPSPPLAGAAAAFAPAQ